MPEAQRKITPQDLLPLGGRVLDVGCGTGQLGEAIASEGFEVYGVDLSGLDNLARFMQRMNDDAGVKKALAEQEAA